MLKMKLREHKYQLRIKKMTPNVMLIDLND